MSESLKRGVENPAVVDLIGFDADAEEVVLTLIEERPWGVSEEQLPQLQAKLNSYLDYVIDGFMVDDYPDYGDKPVRFELECAVRPGDREQGFLTAFRNFASTQGIRFVVQPRNLGQEGSGKTGA